MKRFQQGDHVSYVGDRRTEELGGRRGTVCAHVAGQEHAVVVDFENGSWIMDERYHLKPFDPTIKPKKTKEEMAKETRVEHRGNKRRSAPSDDED